MKTTDQFVIAQLADTNPVPETIAPSAQEKVQAERVLRRVLEDAPTPPRPRARSGLLASVASVLVVLVVAAVALRTGASPSTGSRANGAVQITLRVEATQNAPTTRAAMSREMAVMRRRLTSLGHGFTVRQSGTAAIVVTAPKDAATARPRIVELITQPGVLRFYDWEANVLTPNGKTVASQLGAQNGAAISLSQGAGSGPGAAGAGGTSLYDAVTLAAKQPRVGATRLLSRLGPEYYLFGTPGSPACAAAARAEGAARSLSGHCLLAGPLDPGGSISRSRAMAELAAQVPAGVNPSDGHVLVVPQGTVIAQAEQSAWSARVPIFSPAARFFVMRDRVALTGTDIAHPTAGTEESGAPDVTFGFTGTGRAAFEQATRALAHRGANVSRSVTLDQHFAVALDNQLLTVPSISYKQYPDGIIAAQGADITGGFTAQAARDLATQLRYGALPLAVRVAR